MNELSLYSVAEGQLLPPYSADEFYFDNTGITLPGGTGSRHTHGVGCYEKSSQLHMLKFMMQKYEYSVE